MKHFKIHLTDNHKPTQLWCSLTVDPFLFIGHCGCPVCQDVVVTTSCQYTLWEDALWDQMDEACSPSLKWFVNILSSSLWAQILKILRCVSLRKKYWNAINTCTNVYSWCTDLICRRSCLNADCSFNGPQYLYLCG